jgi:preprotein translocase subunit SecY
MIESLQNIARIPELRRRVLYGLGLLAVYRVGGAIPTPGVNASALAETVSGGGVLGLYDLFAGGYFSRFTIFALGIMPYITSSIVLQLLTVVWPYLEKISKEGDVGRKKITQWTRYLTVALAMVQSFSIAMWLESVPGVVPSPGWKFRLMVMLTLTTGTAFVMWLGEQITERGIGNGISLIIMAGIVAGLFPALYNTMKDVFGGQEDWNILKLLLLLGVVVVVMGAIVFVERAQRRIPIQYARRVRGRRMVGGVATFLPLRVNTGGVIPVIFASSLLAIPQIIITQLRGIFPDWDWLAVTEAQLQYAMPYYDLIYVVLIVFFCYFYTSIIFNPVDTADNMKKVGGFIPGIRPGKRTAEYIDKVLTRLTFAGALYLSLVSLLPMFLSHGLRWDEMAPGFLGGLFTWMPDLLKDGFRVKFFFGGTSLLIVVGVTMDTVQQIESQLVMRHYDGFMKGTRMRGRRG